MNFMEDSLGNPFPGFPKESSMKFIPPKIHAFLDIVVIAALFAAPSLFRFVSEAAGVSYTLGVVYIGLVLATAYPLGLFKWIPFTVHGTIELILSPLLVIMPWLAGFSFDPISRNFFIVSGVALFFVWLTTDYKAAESPYGRKGMHMGGTGRIRRAT